MLVENKFKNNWELFIGKDRKYFKNIIKSNYDFYHFDSDKSYRGKSFYLRNLLKINSFIAYLMICRITFLAKRNRWKVSKFIINNDGAMVWFLVVKISTLRFWGFSNEKILLFTSSLNNGGAENQVLKIFNALSVNNEVKIVVAKNSIITILK